MPKKMSFKSMKDSIVSPEFLITDFGKMDYPPQLHVAFLTLHKFEETHGRSPRAWNQEDAAEFLNMAKEYVAHNKIDIELDEKLFDTFAKVNVQSLQILFIFLHNFDKI